MALYKTFRKWFKHIYPPAVFLAVFLTPSIVFWTSGILKETHTIFFLGFFLYQFSLLIELKKITALIWTVILGILILLSRTFLAVSLIFPVVFLICTSLFKTNKLLKSIGLALILLAAIFLLLNANGINLYKVLSDKQVSFNYIGKNALSFFHIRQINHPIDLVKYIPIALINVYLQPQLLGFDSWLFIFPIIENIDILTIIIIAIIYYKSPPLEDRKYLVFVLLIWIIGGSIIGLTVPIQGAIARYKSVLMPFLLISIFSIIDWDKLKSKYLTPGQGLFIPKV